MSLSDQDVTKIAQLAKLQLSEHEKSEVTDRLNQILGLVDQLQAANTQGISPMAHPIDAVQYLRSDAVTEKNQRELYQSIAPATESGLYLVPKVIE